MSESPASLQIRALHAGYDGVKVVHGIDLQVAAGTITVLAGSNGAGKTTTLRAIAGVLPVESGTISLGGETVTGLPSDQRVDRGLVMVPEGRLIFPTMTVDENLRVGAFAPRVRARSPANLERVYGMFPRLRERRTQLGGTLSGGEQQMLALGRGLMAEPRVLILDEPTLGLAPMMAQSIFALIRSLRDLGITVLLAEQNVHEALALADDGYVLENGRIVLNGAGAQLLEEPALRRAYLGL